MSNRNLLNLGLLFFIIALVAVVVIEPGKKVASAPPTLTTLKSSDIKHIKITRHTRSSTEQEIEFNKTSAGWVMLKPYATSANTFRIDSILELLSAASLSQNSLKNLNPITFGLDQPRATITLNKKTSIIFGHNKSLKNHRYIQIDSTLHMIADTFMYQLAAKTESYINHKLLVTDSNIVKLTLPSITLEKTNSTWEVTPKTKSFSADSLNQLVDEWQLSQAYDVNKINPSQNKKPDIIIQLKNNKKLHFEIENNAKSFNLINLDTGIRYLLSTDRKDKLLKPSNISLDN